MTTTSSSNPIPTPPIIDDKTPHILPFILHYLTLHQKTHPTRPFIIGLNGIQGAGKTTLVNTLYEILTRDHGLETLVLSIDDLYLTRADQEKLARENKGNKLVQFRGEPGIYLFVLLLYAIYSASSILSPPPIPNPPTRHPQSNPSHPANHSPPHQEPTTSPSPAPSSALSSNPLRPAPTSPPTTNPFTPDWGTAPHPPAP
ncbi:hypothetical protein BOTNAR_0177g00080 [Botryotinia narcissicola]|uniref:SRP54-type proteins GTP-binding domain-containing protein n=1 Tax=Botryotinia narcissicola TaxID=278944 RepID=A0A4Z1IB34_9HELO|nr:hypothetical protein BOTNAR_0177g00080 [Botryotinia narcissicola]